MCSSGQGVVVDAVMMRMTVCILNWPEVLLMISQRRLPGGEVLGLGMYVASVALGESGRRTKESISFVDLQRGD